MKKIKIAIVIVLWWMREQDVQGQVRRREEGRRKRKVGSERWKLDQAGIKM